MSAPVISNWRLTNALTNMCQVFRPMTSFRIFLRGLAGLMCLSVSMCVCRLVLWKNCHKQRIGNGPWGIEWSRDR